MIRLASLALLAVPLPTASAAQLITDSTLRVDIESAPAEPFPSNQEFLESAGGQALFYAARGNDLRLWLTDGTPAGTRTIRETPTGQQVLLNDFTIAVLKSKIAASLPDGSFIVQAEVEGSGIEPVRIDPVADTATLVADLFPGSPSSTPASFVEAGGAVFFIGLQPTGDFAIFRTDGTAAGTQALTVLPAGSNPKFLMAGAGGVFVIADGAGEGLYFFSPSGGAATLLASGPSASLQAGFLNEVLEFGGGLLLPFDDGVQGREPWYSDGTPAGTVQLGDLTTGTIGSLPTFHAENAGVALFSATADGVGREYWVTDGTVAGTVLLGDLNPGLQGGAPALAGGTAIGAGFVMSVFDPNDGVEPWFTGATPQTTFPLADLDPGSPSSIGPWDGIPFGGLVYFSAGTNVAGTELHVTDGTPAGTGLAADLEPGMEGSFVATLSALPNGLLLKGELGSGLEPLFSDGTVAGTFQLANTVADPISLSSFPRDPVRLGDRVYLGAQTDADGEGLFSVVRNQPEAVLVDSDPGSFFGYDPQPIIGVNGRVVYKARTGGGSFSDRAIFAHDPATNSIEPLLEVILSTGDTVATIYQGAAHFIARADGDARRLWRTDGTAAGTEFLNLGLNFANSPDDLRVFGGQLWFLAGQGSNSLNLWRSDGTTAGTTLVQAFPNDPVLFLGETEDHLFFHTVGSPLFREVYSVDAAGTVVTLTDALTGFAEILDVLESTTVGDKLLFTGAEISANALPPDLYVSDGTVAGTQALGLFPTPDEDNIVFGLVEAGGVVFFWTQEAGSSNWTLWRTEGTGPSTQVLLQESGISVGTGVPLGSGAAAVYRLDFPVSGQGYWRVQDGVNTIEQIASYDGAFGGGTFPLDQFSARVANELLVLADDSLTGQEVHALPIAELGGYVAEPFGQVCGDARIGSSGEARLGKPFTVNLEASAGAPAGLFVAFQEAYAPLDAGCASLLGPSVLLANAVADGSGKASVTFQVPAVPSLLGLAFYNQWSVVSAGGPLFGLLDVSNGLEVVIGG